LSDYLIFQQKHHADDTKTYNVVIRGKLASQLTVFSLILIITICYINF